MNNLTTVIALTAVLVSLLMGGQTQSFNVAGSCGVECVLSISSDRRTVTYVDHGERLTADKCVFLVDHQAANIQGVTKWKGKRGKFEVGIKYLHGAEGYAVYEWQGVGPGGWQVKNGRVSTLR